MKAHYNRRAEAERRQRDNDSARILELAKREHGFSVSLRWRDDALRALCYRMVKSGVLTRSRLQHGAYTFRAVPGATADMYRRPVRAARSGDAA